MNRTSSGSDAAPIYRTVFTIAHARAGRYGLSREDVEDCTQEFLLRVLTTPDRYLHPDPNGVSGYMGAWLSSCAENWVRDYRRRRIAVERREASWPEQQNADGEPPRSLDFPDGGLSPVQHLLQDEFWQVLAGALARLEPIQRSCFLAFYLHDRSIAQIAAASGRSPNAIKLILSRTRRQIMHLLERRGWTETDLRELVSPTAS
jgi:RNA polymerase sigma factor (sigma-70 family)